MSKFAILALIAVLTAFAIPTPTYAEPLASFGHITGITVVSKGFTPSIQEEFIYIDEYIGDIEEGPDFYKVKGKRIPKAEVIYTEEDTWVEYVDEEVTTYKVEKYISSNGTEIIKKVPIKKIITKPIAKKKINLIRHRRIERKNTGLYELNNYEVLDISGMKATVKVSMRPTYFCDLVKQNAVPERFKFKDGVLLDDLKRDIDDLPIKGCLVKSKKKNLGGWEFELELDFSKSPLIVTTFGSHSYTITWATQADWDAGTYYQTTAELGVLKLATYTATLTESFYTGVGDGHVGCSGTDWSAVRNATAGTGVSYTGTLAEVQAQWHKASGTYQIARMFLPVDTSGIPDDATITSASLKIYRHSQSAESEGKLWAVVVETTQASVSSLTLEDYDQVGSTEGSNRVTVGSGWNTFTLNATGIGWINRTGFTKIGLRADNDITNTVPGTYWWAAFYTSESDADPYLEVTYSSTSFYESGYHITAWKEPLAGTQVAFQTLNATVTLPAGTSASAIVQVSDDASTVKDSVTISLLTGTNSYDISSLNARYIRIRTELATTDSTVTPEIDSYTITAFGEPQVSTLAASAVEETTATLNGEVTNLGNGLAEVWFEYGLDTTYGTATTKQTLSATGTFNQVISGLSQGTIYHYRACASNSYGTSYGSDVTFTTKPEAPTAFTLTVISDTQIDLSWTKGVGATNTEIRRKVGSYPLSITDGTQVYFGTGTSFSDTGLDPGMTYYYRAWSEVNGVYSDNYAEQFATTYKKATVSTIGAFNVGETYATLKGEVTDLGISDTDCRVYFEYGTTDLSSVTPEQVITATGVFQAEITGLEKATLYQFRAVAVNDAGTAYGITLSLFTEIPQSADNYKYYANLVISNSSSNNYSNIGVLFSANPEGMSSRYYCESDLSDVAIIKDGVIQPTSLSKDNDQSFVIFLPALNANEIRQFLIVMNGDVRNQSYLVASSATVADAPGLNPGTDTLEIEAQGLFTDGDKICYKDLAYSLESSGGILYAKIYDGITWITTSTPTPSSEAKIKMTYDGATLRLFVDGEEKSSVAATGLNLSSTANLIVADVSKYVRFVNLRIGSSLKGRWFGSLYLVGTEIKSNDLSGQGHTATVILKNSANPAGVSASISSLKSVSVAQSQIPPAKVAELVKDFPKKPTGMYQDIENSGKGTNLPFGDVLAEAAAAGGIPLSFLWFLIAFGISCFIGFLVYMKTGSFFATAIGIGLGLTFFSITGIIPFWTVIVFGIIAAGLIVLQRTYSF